MQILIKNKVEKSEYDQIYMILSECDSEFIPPLSDRNSCDTRNFEIKENKNNITEYFNSIFHLPRIFFMGYSSKDEQFHSFAVVTPKNASNELYINVCCVQSNYRQCGMGKNLILGVINYAKTHHYNKVVTRTWSTNEVQISLLKKLNFKLKSHTKEIRTQNVFSVYCEYIISR